jgi:hypothetical protein
LDRSQDLMHDSTAGLSEEHAPWRPTKGKPGLSVAPADLVRVWINVRSAANILSPSRVCAALAGTRDSAAWQWEKRAAARSATNAVHGGDILT